ncbi:E3 ubiquitin-protein ligase RNF14 [Halotydeus destructor]|nr:E3 ubiquitin-protein ligase RNF14 [Halotydeus destructor]
MSISNSEIQGDEILALESIFEPEIFVVDDEKRNGRFLAHPKLPSEGLVVKYSDKELGDNDAQFEVEHLPPFELQFEFPDTYPSSTSPAFLLSCPWLSLRDLSSLCGKLEEIWVTSNSEILFTWFSFLQDEALSYLQFDSLDISHLIREPKFPKESAKLQFKPLVHGGIGKYDGRAIYSHPGIELVNKLLAYNDYRREELYKNEWLRCNICMTHNKGHESISFHCNHTTCKECLSGFFRVQIREGNIHGLKCPEFKCSTLATTDLIASLVTEEEYKRYDQLVLASVISSMGDVVFCPRVGCNSPVIPDNDSQLASCKECSFAFCSNCKFTFHGISPCRLFRNDADRRQIMTVYQEASPEEKQGLEKLYGKVQLEKALNEYLSEKWIDEWSKPCPQCKAQIEKEEGCHKMTCWRCNTYFCWLCLTAISTANPYTHFNDPQSTCFNQLFLGMDVYPE